MTVPPPARQDTDETRQQADSGGVVPTPGSADALSDVLTVRFALREFIPDDSREAMDAEAAAILALDRLAARVHTLEQALKRVLDWPLPYVPNATVETYSLPGWLAKEARDALRAVVLEGAAGQLTTTDASDTTSEQSVGAPASQARGTEQETQRRREIDWTNQPGESPT